MNKSGSIAENITATKRRQIRIVLIFFLVVFVPATLLFQNLFYSKTNSYLIQANAETLKHFLTTGDIEGIKKQLNDIVTGSRVIKVSLKKESENYLVASSNSKPLSFSWPHSSSFDFTVPGQASKYRVEYTYSTPILYMLGGLSTISLLAITLGMILSKTLDQIRRKLDVGTVGFLEAFKRISERDDNFDFAAATEKMPSEFVEALRVSKAHSSEAALSEDRRVRLEIEEHQSQLGRKLAHDLRGPVMAIQAILKKLSQDDHNLKTIGESALTRLNRMANSLLEENKSNTEKNINFTSLRFSADLTLSKRFEQLIEEVRITCPKNISITSSFEDRDSALEISDINVEHLLRIIYNLASNSIEAIGSEKVGKIKIHLQLNPNHIFCAVEDDGPGMDTEQKNNIIYGRPFTTKKDGHGIGLSSTIKHIKSIKGEFNINTTEGSGTAISFTWPFAIKLRDNQP